MENKMNLNHFKLAIIAATALSSIAITHVHAEGVLRLNEVAVGEIDPAKASDYADSILMFNIYDTLVVPNQGRGGFAAHLATSFEVQDKVFTFTLREGVKFHSGNIMSAEDVVFSLNRLKSMGLGLSYLFGDVETIEATDANTVKFTLNKPSASFIASLVRLPIIDKKAIMANIVKSDEDKDDMGDWGEKYLSTNSAGTGAYKVTSHNPQDETVMQKNPNYFLDIDKAAPSEVRLRYGLEAATVRTLISQNKHDISSQWLPPEVLKALAKGGSQLLVEKGTQEFYIKMNTAKAPLDDVHCRLALSNAFDYNSVLKLVSITDDVAMGSAATGAIPSGMLGEKPESEKLVRNLDAAKKHLSACKYDPKDFEINISWISEVPLEERFALLMQANFAEIGVKSKITKMPWALFAEQVSKAENTPHISQLFVNAVTGDPDTLLFGQYHSSVSGTWQSPEHLKDAIVDQALEQGRSASTIKLREAAYSKLNERLIEIAPSIYGYNVQAVFAASNRVKVPALSDPEKSFGLEGMGFTFRLMQINE
ncbi:MAG: ABC transporter substrate-binding protein [Rhizobiales bacterium]|nr:ABC transporter substrate-binding protein [Hyphomicrobiales bacterium]